MDKIKKSDLEWREILGEKAFPVCRQKGTERSFTGAYHDHHEEGKYLCAGCGLDLFDSTKKYDSGTGWPSFWDANVDHIEEEEDRSLFARRTEVHCRRCGCHLGHVFPDGPDPSGLRYCINSVSLQFEKRSV